MVWTREKERTLTLPETLAELERLAGMNDR